MPIISTSVPSKLYCGVDTGSLNENVAALAVPDTAKANPTTDAYRLSLMYITPIVAHWNSKRIALDSKALVPYWDHFFAFEKTRSHNLVS